MRPWYINTVNLAKTIYQTIILCEGVLNQVPGTQSHKEYLKMIRDKTQYNTDRCHTVRRLNRPRQLIM